MSKTPSDAELMKQLSIDAPTLKHFKDIQKQGIKEARRLAKKKSGKIKVLGISGSARDEFDMAQEKSNSETLLEICLKRCRELGAQTELLPLRKFDIKYCKACYSTVNTQCHFPCSCYQKGTPRSDDMSKTLYDKILAADAIVFATPVNNFKMSSLMALFLDRCISLDGSLSPANPQKTKDRELNKKHLEFIRLTASDDTPGSGFIRRFTGKTAGVIVTGHEEGAALVISSLFMTLNHFGMSFPPFSTLYAMSSVCNPTSADKALVTGPCFAEETKLLAENIINSAKSSNKSGINGWRTVNSAN